MSADEFFELHSIEEINKKTRISPISLRFIKNREFDKLPRVKFIGFVKLIEKHYKVDLSELIEEYENYYKEKKVEEVKEENIIEEVEKKEFNYLWILIILLFVVSSILYFSFVNGRKKDIQNNSVNSITEVNDSQFKENNNSENFNKNNSIDYSTNKIEQNITTQEENESALKVSEETNITKQKEYNITIVPNKLLWFKALNIDNNKTKEYLTSNPKILSGNYYIKFGHGNLTIIYNDMNITPNTNHIIRMLFKNGKYQYLKKHNEYEK
jgi:cytoskeletal protein RodZ